MNAITEVKTILAELGKISPAGFAIGLHLEFTTSRYIFQTYPKAWMHEYSRRGFILGDPTIRWGVENLGWVRWADLEKSDHLGVLAAAAEFGLKYGVSISVEGHGSRSLGSFASTERDFSDEDIGSLSRDLARLHEATHDVAMESQLDGELKRLAATLG